MRAGAEKESPAPYKAGLMTVEAARTKKQRKKPAKVRLLVTGK